MTIYTYIPFSSTGDLMVDFVASFESHTEARLYASAQGCPNYDIVKNEIK
jgi:hypothetical protein